MLNKITYISSLLIFVSMITSCRVANIGRTEKNVLYVNRFIPQQSEIEITTEERKGFSIQGKNTSRDDVVLKFNNDRKLFLKKDSIFTLDVDSNSSLIIQNISLNEVLMKMKVFNHSSKVIVKE